MTNSTALAATRTVAAWQALLSAPPDTVSTIVQEVARQGDIEALRNALEAGVAVAAPSDDALVDRFFSVASELLDHARTGTAADETQAREVSLLWAKAIKSQGLLQLALCLFPIYTGRSTRFTAVELLIETGADPYGLVQVTPRMHRLQGMHAINAAGELMMYFSPGSEEVVRLAEIMFADISAGDDLDAAFPPRVTPPAALAGICSSRASLPEFAAAMNFTELLAWCMGHLCSIAQRAVRLRLGAMLLKIFDVVEHEDGVLRRAAPARGPEVAVDRRTAMYLIANGAEFENPQAIWPQVLELIRLDAPFAQDLAAGQVLHFTLSKQTQWQALAGLLEAGAVDLAAKFDGNLSMLDFAARFSNKVAVKKLLECGATPVLAESVLFANPDHGDNDEILNMLRVARLRQVIIDASQRAPLDTNDDCHR